MWAMARVPGSWGELVQGEVAGEDRLLTCPVNLYTVAVARAAGVPAARPPAPQAGAGAGAATGQPVPWRVRGRWDRPRTRAALAHLGGLGGEVRLYSRLRPGAGMASSTADLTAAQAAAVVAAGLPLPDPATLFQHCLALEPTDGIMFPGIALVDHRRGRYWELLGPPPPLAILGVDPGGQVETAAFNRRQDLAAANRRKEPVVAEALALARQALARGDGDGLAAAATLSARAHQAILPHPLWEAAGRLAREIGALGVNVAHSGTVIGLLLDPLRADIAGARAYVAERLGLPVRVLRLIGGGVEVCTAAAAAGATGAPGAAAHAGAAATGGAAAAAEKPGAAAYIRR